MASRTRSWFALGWLAWILGLALLAGLALYPLSTWATRAAGALLCGVLWIGLLPLAWRWRWFRMGWALLSLGSIVFLAIPGLEPGTPETRKSQLIVLRADYVKAMFRYEGTRYYWGGESPYGIDCSGLVRRGLVDALLWDGLRWLQPRLVREAISVWWHDTSARDLGVGDRTRSITSVPSLNSAPAESFAAGDLAITTNGLHVLAYAGGDRWIEADPAAQKVMTISTPGPDGGWLGTPMNVVRWRILEEE